MLSSGVPAARAVRVSGEGSSPALREASVQIARGLESGIPLPDLMARHPGVFPPYVVGMASSGYAHGRLDSALLAAAEQMHWDCELKRRVSAATVYPLVTLTVIVAVAVLVSVVAVPSFEHLYASVGAQLPAVTRAVVWFSRVVRGLWWVVIPAAVLVSSAWSHPDLGRPLRLLTRRAVLLLPMIGGVLARVRAARALRVIARLYEAGVVMPRCFHLAADAAQDPDMAARLRMAADMVSTGSPVSVAVAASGAFDAQTVEMVRAGEESGALGRCLLDAAAHLEEEAEHGARLALSFMEPAAALLVGAVAMVCALALYLPVFDVPGLLLRR